MSSSAVFVGTGFYVTGAQVRAGNVIRVTFSSAPKLVDPTALNDGLNPLNYTLSGPGPGSFAAARIVVGDTLGVDLELAASLVVGPWVVTVSGVVSSTLSPLTAPTAANFTVLVGGNRTSLANGARNDSAAQIIRKHLNSALRGPNWDSVIAALATGDDANWNNAQAGIQQLFLASATGQYLAKRASDQGVVKPHDVGMADEIFRRLAIKTANGALLHTAIKDILEVYYGADSSRAYAECSCDEPYNLNSPGELHWTLDGKQSFAYDFPEVDFGSPPAARAAEVAFALTQHMRRLRSSGFALPYHSPDTGLNRVRIYSGALGLGSSVQITGGLAQNVFQFPALLPVYSGSAAGYSWVHSAPNTSTTRLALTLDTSIVTPAVDVAGVRDGDYVAITPSAGSGLSETYAIKNVRTSWSGTLFTQSFDIDRVGFAGTAVQLDNAAYTFYRAETRRLSGPRSVSVAQTAPNQLDVILPATAQVVGRGPRTGAYLHAAPPLAIASVKRLASGRTTITTTLTHGLGAGDIGRHVILDSISTSNALPYVSPGNSAVTPAAWTYNATHLGFIAAAQTPPALATQYGTATTIGDSVIFAGGYSSAVTGITNHYTAVTPTIVAEGSEADGASRHSHTWTAAASLTTARNFHAASEYGGDLLATGGLDGGGAPLASAELYDTAAHTWSSAGSMSLARSGHQQVMLDDGQVLSMGGSSASLTPTNTTEIYNGTWSASTSMIHARADFQAVKLSDGRVLAIGGGVGGMVLGVWTYQSSDHTCEIFDGVNWQSTGSMAMARGWSQAVLLPDDYVLVVGGLGYPPSQPTGGMASLATAEMWSPVTGRWSRIASPSIRRHSHLAKAVGDKVIVLGGESFAGDDATVVECFDIATRTWSRLPYKITSSGSPCFGDVTPYGELVFSGGSATTFEAFIDGQDRLGGTGLRDQFAITAVPTTTSFEVQTITSSGAMQYATSYSVTTQTGTVSTVKAEDGAVNAPGPYTLDPFQGIATTATRAIATTTMSAGQQYKELTLDASGASFSLSGYIVLGFGTSQQSKPIRFLDCYQSGPTEYKLVLDYAYRLEFDYAAGAQVILLSQQAPFDPEHGETLGLFYLTASSAGRVAAQQAVLDAVASGVDANIQIVYPGDTGLGGAGLPTYGAQKLSDIAGVFAGDEVDSEVQTRRDS